MQKMSRLREKATARDINGRVTPGSGNLRNPYLKEDVHCDLFVLQHKLTKKGSYSLKASEFEKTKVAAFRQVKSPLWRIEMVGADLAVLRWSDFLQFLKDLRDAASH
jgi:hypothetical protein